MQTSRVNDSVQMEPRLVSRGPCPNQAQSMCQNNGALSMANGDSWPSLFSHRHLPQQFYGKLHSVTVAKLNRDCLVNRSESDNVLNRTSVAPFGHIDVTHHCLTSLSKQITDGLANHIGRSSICYRLPRRLKHDGQTPLECCNSKLIAFVTNDLGSIQAP